MNLSRKSRASRIAFARQRQHEGRIAMKSGVNLVRASPAAFLSKNTHVGECAYVHQDESVIQDALKRLTYVHRVDHTPGVSSWATEELLFRLDHVEELSKGQEAAIHKVNAWMALDHENTPETWG